MSDQFFGGDFGPPADDPNDPENENAPEYVGRGHNEFDDVDLDVPDEFLEEGDAVYAALLARLGEAAPQPRLSATRRVAELLGDPQRSYPVIHITGTNGKTSTSRIIESILRAYGLRTGLFTSPHLERLNERIMIDGVPISNEALAANWRDVEPFIDLADKELEAAGEPHVTFFEALSVLAFASFADAPVDVAVIEVGMGGEWDSTNVADGQVAVFAPISLDHTARLGTTVAEIARTKSGIIKPAAQVVSALQSVEALAELERAAELSESTFAVEGDGFRLLESTVAVGGQLVSIQGLAGTYRDHFLPLYGNHQGHNAALAVAAVESFLGGGTQALVDDVVHRRIRDRHLARSTAARGHRADGACRRGPQPRGRRGTGRCAAGVFHLRQGGCGRGGIGRQGRGGHHPGTRTGRGGVRDHELVVGSRDRSR